MPRCSHSCAIWPARHGSNTASTTWNRSASLSRYMDASVRVLEMRYAHLVRDAEETARAKLDAHAASV